MEDLLRSIAADEFRKGSDGGGLRAKHRQSSGVDPVDVGVGIEREHTCGNVFEDGFHQFAAALDFLDGLLKAGSEVVDLLAGKGELAGHLIEGVHEDAELVVSAGSDAVIEIAARDLLRGFREGLDGHSDPLRQEKSDPRGSEKKKQCNQEQAEKNFALEQTQALVLGSVGGCLALNIVQALQKIIRNIAADEDGTGSKRRATGDEKVASNLPDLRTARENCQPMEGRGRRVRHAGGFRAVAIDHPDGVEFGIGANHIVAKVVIAFVWRGEPVGDALRVSIEAVTFLGAHFGDESAALLVGDFERLGEPDVHGAIDEGVAEEEEEDDREERDAHRAQDHFGFEARAEQAGAVFGGQANDIANQNQPKNDECDDDERGKSEKDDEVTAVLQMDRNIERTEGENCGGEHGDRKTAEDEPETPSPVFLRCHIQ